MRSFKNHLSLIIAIFTILFSVQTFFIVERVIAAYEEKLKHDYSLIVVAANTIENSAFTSIDSMIGSAEAISPDSIIKRLEGEMKQKNIELLKLSMPRFYRLHLTRYPTPDELESLSKKLLRHNGINRVESFAQSHDTVYKLLLLFKQVTQLFAIAVFTVTSLLIIKEMRLWQFQHVERMNIMALFGAPVWLRSAVLFRLAIVDALLATMALCGTFLAIDQQGWVSAQLQDVGIDILVFDLVSDGGILCILSLSLSIFLASMIIMGHKEEV